MTWEMVGALGELIGAIAVLVSLVYLAVQVRFSMQANRVSNYHAAQQQLWSAAETIASDEVLSGEINRSLNRGLAKVSPEHLTRVSFVLASFFFGMENLLALYERHQIDEEQWANVFENNFILVGSTLGREVLAQRPGPISRRLERAVTAHALRQTGTGGPDNTG